MYSIMQRARKEAEKNARQAPVFFSISAKKSDMSMSNGENNK